MQPNTTQPARTPFATLLRRPGVVLALIVIIFAVILLSLATLAPKPAQQPAQLAANSATPTANPSQAGGLPSAAVSIVGSEHLAGSLLSDGQAANTITVLQNYLASRSGLRTKRADILGIARPNSQTITFTLTTRVPKASYTVTAILTNQYQTTPGITIEQTKEQQ